MLAAAQQVRCVEGCGGDAWLPIIGLVVALVSLAIACRAWWVGEKEHKEFMRQLSARADFALDLYLVHPRHEDDRALIETTAPEVQLGWQMGIRNSGRRAATDVGINFLMPADLTRPTWAQQNLARIRPSKGEGVMSTAEELPGSDGSRHPAQFLFKTLPRKPITGAVVGFATAIVELPSVGDERVVPVKFKVWSDELPDDVGDRIVTMETTVRRVAPGATSR